MTIPSTAMACGFFLGGGGVNSRGQLHQCKSRVAQVPLMVLLWNYMGVNEISVRALVFSGCAKYV